MGFSKIKFGMAAAESEKSEYPVLLLEGFLDAYGYINKVIKENTFLIYGQKGSGKSAIGSKIELTAAMENSDLIVKQYMLDEFDYKSFTGILSERDSPELRYPSSWEFLLFICFLESFKKDMESHCRNPKYNLRGITKQLEKLSLLPNAELGQIVKTVVKKEFKVQLGILSGSRTSESNTNRDIRGLYEGLKQVMYCVETSKTHIVIIDGLDSVLTRGEVQIRVLSALLLIADRMNKKFRENGVKAKVVILIREDLLDKLSDPNKNKIIQDSGISLDWYQDVKDLKLTNLNNLINLRARVSLSRNVDVISEFLPLDLDGRETYKYLFENTRHTPRDIIQLMNSIQKYTTREKPSKNDVLNGLRHYSNDYFIQEIRDELTGFTSDEEKAMIFKIITSLGVSMLSIAEIKQRAIELGADDFDCEKVLAALYDCGAIGNFDPRNGRFAFKYRNRHTEFNPKLAIAVHYGLYKALNLEPIFIGQGKKASQDDEENLKDG